MKSEKTGFDKDVQFVAGHYRRGTFVPRMRFGTPVMSWWRESRRWAAAVLIAVTLGAGAMICYRVLKAPEPAAPPPPVPVEKPSPVPAPIVEEPAPKEPAVNVIERIEFTDTPVSAVARKAEEVYGVKLRNLPSDDPSITISYEGTAADFVATLNELLGSNIAISD